MRMSDEPSIWDEAILEIGRLQGELAGERVNADRLADTLRDLMTHAPCEALMMHDEWRMVHGAADKP